MKGSIFKLIWVLSIRRTQGLWLSLTLMYVVPVRRQRLFGKLPDISTATAYISICWIRLCSDRGAMTVLETEHSPRLLLWGFFTQVTNSSMGPMRVTIETQVVPCGLLETSLNQENQPYTEIQYAVLHEMV